MLPSKRSSSGDARPKSKTPADRAEECTAVQRRLKEEAADRRKIALASGNMRKPTGLSQQSGHRRAP
jgi:hypothetical protein